MELDRTAGSEDATGAEVRSSQWALIVGIAVLGILVSAVLCQMRLKSEKRVLESAFQTESANCTALLKRETDSFIEVLVSLGRLHGVSGAIDKDAFTEFVDKGLHYHAKILGSFAWAPRVAASERLLYETAMRLGGVPSFRIWVLGDTGELGPSEERSEYFPVSYAGPPGSTDLALGYDLGSEPGNRLALERALRERRAIMSSASWPPFHRAEQSARLVFSPIRGLGEEAGNPASIDGFVVSVLKPSEIIQRALQYVATDDIHLLVLERTAAERDRLVFALSDVSPSSMPSHASGLLYEADLNVAGQEWRISCAPTADLIRRHQTWQPWGILIIGLTITGLLALYLNVLTGRTRMIEQTVRERTAKLKEAMTERRRMEQEVLDVSNREKRRVGQDLHDSLGQQLTGIGFLCSVLEKDLEDATSDKSADAGKISDLVKESISQLRRIARGLAPVEMAEEGLAAALRRLTKDTQELFGITCELVGDMPIHDDAMAVNLYHIAQEAVNNAVRHGQPNEVTVSLAEEAEGTGSLTVENDGEDAGIQLHREGGMGMRIMRYRAEMVGGELEISSRPGGGTIVRCMFNNRLRHSGENG